MLSNQISANMASNIAPPLVGVVLLNWNGWNDTTIWTPRRSEWVGGYNGAQLQALS